MDNLVALSRAQFGITTVYHFLFVPLTLGLSIFMAIFETAAYRTNDAKWRRLAQFFGSLFLINFAMGVVTGIVQEFQFGMNWSSYSKFVGDIFGAPLAIEALAAFFMESTFLGLWIFGRDKLPKAVHLATIWLVAFGSNLSAYWIIVANSFMQEPVGYTVRNGRAEMTDFFALIGNPHALLQFSHVFSAALATAAFFIAGVSAWKILKKHEAEVFQKGLKTAVVIGLAATVLVIGAGDAQGKYLVKHQPMKMAAAEALWETADPAPLSLFAVIDEQNRRNVVDIGIPNLLSFMSYNSLTGEVRGLNDLQAEFEQKYGEGNYMPPVTISFWSFRIMVGLGSLMLLVGLVSLWFFRKGRIFETKWLLWALLFMIPAPYLCNSFGWILTEVGRQPWLVYGVLQVPDGVSASNPAWSVLFTVVGFTLLYGVLAVADVWLIVKEIRKTPAPASVKGSSGKTVGFGGKGV